MDSPGGKGDRCVRLTTYHPCSAERQEIRGLNLPGPPWVISTACCGRDLCLYLCYTNILDMFRALTCPSSGGKIVFTQHLVSSLSVNVCTVHFKDGMYQCYIRKQCVPRSKHSTSVIKTNLLMTYRIKLLFLLRGTKHINAM